MALPTYPVLSPDLFDLHFPAVYVGDFLDRIKVIRGAQITPLRDLIVAATAQNTHDD